MASVRISRPDRNATQAGSRRGQQWLMEFDAVDGRGIDPLMGWTSQTDMRQQVKLWFDTLEDAVAYAEREGLAYRVEPLRPPAEPPAISYSDNFRHDRRGLWTH